jgi:hypothetical protein
MEVLSSKLLWEFLGNYSAADSTEYFLSVCHFLHCILKGCRGHHALVTSALSIILRSRLFKVGNDQEIEFQEIEIGIFQEIENFA